MGVVVVGTGCVGVFNWLDARSGSEGASQGDDVDVLRHACVEW